MGETRKRSLAKAILYRIIGVVGTAIIVFLFTRKIDMSAGIAVADFLAGIILYYCYDRIWNIVPWGKEKS